MYIILYIILLSADRSWPSACACACVTVCVCVSVYMICVFKGGDYFRLATASMRDLEEEVLRI